MVERITGQNCKPHLESLVFGNDDTDTHTPVRVLAQTHKYAHSRTGKKGKHEQTNLIHWHVVTQIYTGHDREKKKKTNGASQTAAHDRDEPDTIFYPDQDGRRTAGIGVVHSQKQHRDTEREQQVVSSKCHKTGPSQHHNNSRHNLKRTNMICYLQLGRVSRTRAKLLPSYFVCIPVCVCAHTMGFRSI